MIVSGVYFMWGTAQAMRHARVLRRWMRKDYKVTNQGVTTLDASIHYMATDYSQLYLK